MRLSGLLKRLRADAATAPPPPPQRRPPPPPPPSAATRHAASSGSGDVNGAGSGGGHTTAAAAIDAVDDETIALSAAAASAANTAATAASPVSSAPGLPLAASAAPASRVAHDAGGGDGAGGAGGARPWRVAVLCGGRGAGKTAFMHAALLPHANAYRPLCAQYLRARGKWTKLDKIRTQLQRMAACGEVWVCERTRRVRLLVAPAQCDANSRRVVTISIHFLPFLW